MCICIPEITLLCTSNIVNQLYFDKIYTYVFFLRYIVHTHGLWRRVSTYVPWASFFSLFLESEIGSFGIGQGRGLLICSALPSAIPIPTASKPTGRGFPGGPLVKTLLSNAVGVSLIPGQGTGSHMPQQRVRMPQLKVPHTATKNQHRQID